MINHLPKPRRFTLQWHITERCNWHCKHCYRNEDYIKDELSTEQLFDILEQYIFLIKKYNFPRGYNNINVAGGEPFIRKDFFEFVERLGRHSDLFSWGLLSNGSFLTKDVVKKLKRINIRSYQVSIEGTEKNNDEIRGEGTFTIMRRSEGVKSAVDSW